MEETRVSSTEARTNVTIRSDSLQLISCLHLSDWLDKYYPFRLLKKLRRVEGRLLKRKVRPLETTISRSR